MSTAWSSRPDGRWLASGGDDWRVRLWETATRKEVRQLAGHTGAVMERSLFSRWQAAGLRQHGLHGPALGCAESDRQVIRLREML